MEEDGAAEEVRSRFVEEVRSKFGNEVCSWLADEECLRLLLVDGTNEEGSTVMLGEGVTTVSLLGRSSSTSMTAVSLLDGLLKNTEVSVVPRAADRTIGFRGIKRDMTLGGVA